MRERGNGQKPNGNKKENQTTTEFLAPVPCSLPLSARRLRPRSPIRPSSSPSDGRKGPDPCPQEPLTRTPNHLPSLPLPPIFETACLGVGLGASFRLVRKFGKRKDKGLANRDNGLSPRNQPKPFLSTPPVSCRRCSAAYDGHFSCSCCSGSLLSPDCLGPPLQKACLPPPSYATLCLLRHELASRRHAANGSSSGSRDKRGSRQRHRWRRSALWAAAGDT